MLLGCHFCVCFSPSHQKCSLNFCESLMNLIVDSNILRFFVSWNLSSLYKSKLIRLSSLTVQKKSKIPSHSKEWLGLHNINDSTGNSMLWFQLQ